MKNVNATTVNTNSNTKGTIMKNFFTSFTTKHPKTAKALVKAKDKLFYITKIIAQSAVLMLLFPAVVVGAVGGCIVLKTKVNKYTIGAVGVVTAITAVASVAVVVATGAWAGLAIATAVTASMCFAVDIYSWFKNRKAK